MSEYSYGSSREEETSDDKSEWSPSNFGEPRFVSASVRTRSDVWSMNHPISDALWVFITILITIFFTVIAIITTSSLIYIMYQLGIPPFTHPIEDENDMSKNLITTFVGATLGTCSKHTDISVFFEQENLVIQINENKYIMIDETLIETHPRPISVSPGFWRCKGYCDECKSKFYFSPTCSTSALLMDEYDAKKICKKKLISGCINKGCTKITDIVCDRF